jgi:hypothetical protein
MIDNDNTPKQLGNAGTVGRWAENADVFGQLKYNFQTSVARVVAIRRSNAACDESIENYQWLGGGGGRDGNGLATRLRRYWQIIGLIETQYE